MKHLVKKIKMVRSIKAACNLHLSYKLFIKIHITGRSQGGLHLKIAFHVGGRYIIN